MAVRRRGFSLLEVLVALAILALAMAALLRTAGLEARSLADSRERVHAQWIASNLITEARLQPAAPAIGSRSGTVEFADRQWAWRMEVAGTGVGSIRRLDVSVGPEGAPVTLTLTGFRGTQ